MYHFFYIHCIQKQFKNINELYINYKFKSIVHIIWQVFLWLNHWNEIFLDAISGFDEKESLL